MRWLDGWKHGGQSQLQAGILCGGFIFPRYGAASGLRCEKSAGRVGRA